MATTTLKKNDPESARQYFAHKLAFTTGPVELDRERQRAEPSLKTMLLGWNSPYGPLELYNLKADPLEKRNLLATEPRKVQELSAALWEHIQRAGAVPWQPPQRLNSQAKAIRSWNWRAASKRGKDTTWKSRRRPPRTVVNNRNPLYRVSSRKVCAKTNSRNSRARVLLLSTGVQWQNWNGQSKAMTVRR